MTEQEKPRYPKLRNCTYWGKGVCAGVGCMAQALLQNSIDLGKSVEADTRRVKIENDAKSAGCPVKLKRPRST